MTKPTPWKIEDYLKTKDDVVNYLQAALEENDFEYLCIACKDVVEVANKKGWLKK